MPSNPDGLSARETFTVATHNVHGWRGGRLEPALRVLSDLRADVLVLQEALLGEVPGVAITPGALAERLSMQIYPALTMNTRGAGFGNILATRLPVRSTTTYRLERAGAEPRSVIDATLDLEGVALRVVGTHLGRRWRNRRYQFQSLFEILGPSTEEPCVLLGDFNEWRRRRSDPIRRIESRFLPSPSLPTFPARYPLLALDRIWASSPLQIESLSVVKTRDSARASDHLPLRAMLSLGQVTRVECTKGRLSGS